MSSPTVFEKVWDKPEEHLFRSEKHGVMAAADRFPKLRLQSVIAPKEGASGQEASIYSYPEEMQLKLFVVASALGRKMLDNCVDGERVITHIEGFNIPNHPHIVMFAAVRNAGVGLYSPGPQSEVFLNSRFEDTLEVMRFTPVEAKELEARLDEVG